jgi:hypothetical protein
MGLYERRGLVNRLGYRDPPAGAGHRPRHSHDRKQDSRLRSCPRYPKETRHPPTEPTRRDPRHHPSSCPGHPTHQINQRRLRRPCGRPARLAAFRGSRQ